MGFVSKEVYKKIYIINKLKTRYFVKRFVSKNSSNIPKILIGYKFSIYNGKIWNKKKMHQYSQGYKFGSFIWSRKIAIYKNKQKKKKKKNKK